MVLPLLSALCASSLTQHKGLDAEVIIVGAGWAGMSTADYLHRHNLTDLMVLEASNRTGGRTHALPAFGHPAVGQFVVERGSNWVQSAGIGAAGNLPDAPSVRHNPMQVLAMRHGLRTTRIPGSTQNMSNYRAVYDALGRQVDRNGTLRARANAAYDCLNATAQHLSRKAGVHVTVRDALTACGWQPSSDVEWAVDWVLTVDDPGFPAELQQAKEALPDQSYQWWGADDLFVVDQRSPRGWARLMDDMTADSIPLSDARLRLGTTVRSISYDCDGASVTTADGSVLTAEQVVVTLPLGVLRRRSYA